MTAVKKKKRLPYGEVNVELFQEVKKKILADPEHFDMEHWGEKEHWEENGKCGTTACIGGWASAIHHLRTHKTLNTCCLIYNSETDILNVRDHERIIMHSHRWPRRFQRPYNKAETPRQRVKIAVEYIDWICGRGK